MNRKKILVLFLMLFPLLIISLSATWIILSRTIFAPSYNPSSDSILFNAYDNQESVIYNGLEQGPTSKNSDILDSNMDFKYRLANTKNFYKDGFPIDAGTYDILIKDKSNTYLDEVVQFTINKATPKLNGSLNLSSIYQGETPLITNEDELFVLGVQNEILYGNFVIDVSSIEFGESTESIKSVDVIVKYTLTQNNQKINYYDGSYSTSVDVKAVSYIIGSQNKYYGTVESALDASNSGDIVTVIPPTKSNYHDTNNSIVPDNISYTIYNNCEIKSGVSLIIPTDQDSLNSVTDSATLKTFINSMQVDDRSRGSNSSYNLFATQNESKYLRVTVKIADNVILKNNGDLIVSGYLSGGTSGACTLGQTSHSYSRILLGNNSQISQENDSANIYCYGYISEQSINNSSKVNIVSGNLYIPFIVDDYKGFSFSWAMTDGAISEERCSPFNQFEMRNIDSQVKIGYNAKVYGITNVYVTYSTMGVDKVFTQQLNILGNDESFFFQLTDSIYSSVNYKFDKNTLVANAKIYGGMILNNFQLKLQESIITVDLSTTEAYFPLSYRINIELFACEDQTIANFDITNQRVKLLPGSSLTIGDKCLLKSNELIVYSAFYDGSIGNGENSAIGSSKPYPLKEGAILKVLSGGRIESNYLAGTVYGDANDISYTNGKIVSKEAWVMGSSGSINPAWNIKDYLEIKEKINIYPLEYLDTKIKLYVGINTFTNYNSYLPSFNILINGASESFNISEYQQVLVFDSLNDYQFEFVNNIYKAHYASSYYKKGQIISYNENNAIIGVINSTLSISNNNNGINEFDVQEVNVTCSTPPINGKIPLYIGKSILLNAEVIDINKSYNKTISWQSLDTSIATVDNSGNVTGVSLGKVIIQAICDEVIGSFEVEVIEEVDVDNIESVYITDASGNSSEKVLGQSTFGGSNNVDYNGKYGNNKQIVFSININPTTAPYSSIEWTLNASATGRQWINDNTQAVNIEKNVTSITVNTGSGTGTSDDKATLKCVVVGLDGTIYTAIFIINHEKDTTCLVEGTLITMADGTQKKVENLEIGDLLLIYNHETGDWDYAPLLVNVHNSEEEILTNIINLYFDDNSSLRIVGEHALFDMNLNKYVYINESNIMEYIGHKFVATECINGTIDTKIITLNRVDITKELVRVYNPASVWHLNLVANNILTLSAGMVNFFDYGENLKYDEELMIKDIQKYGLYTYDDFKDYVSLEVFYAFPFKYFKVAVGKGLITFEDILMLINYYNDSIN